MSSRRLVSPGPSCSPVGQYACCPDPRPALPPDPPRPEVRRRTRRAKADPPEPPRPESPPEPPLVPPRPAPPAPPRPVRPRAVAPRPPVALRPVPPPVPSRSRASQPPLACSVADPTSAGDRRGGGREVGGLGAVARLGAVVVAGRRGPRRRRDRDAPRAPQRRLRRFGQRTRRRVAGLRVLGHPVRDDVVERDGQVRPLLRRPRRLPHQVRVHHRRQALRLERPVPDEALHQHAGEGVDVDALVPVVPGEPLGGHVARAAHAERGAADGGAVERAGDAEVGEVRDPALGLLGPDEQHVRRLHVAVHEGLGVRGVERVGHLGDHVHRARGGERAALDEVREVAAVDEAHVDEELAVDVAVVVDRHDVRVVELRRQRRLALEPAAVLLVGGQLAQEALQRDEPLTARVVGAVDLAHATAPDQGVEPVGPEDLRLHIGQPTGRATATDVASRQTTHTRPSRPATIATGPPPTSTAGPASSVDRVDDAHRARVGVGDVEARAVGRQRQRAPAHPHRRHHRTARGVDHGDLPLARHPHPPRVGDDRRGRPVDGHGRDGGARRRVDHHDVVGAGVRDVEQSPVGAGREPGRLRADRDRAAGRLGRPR